MRINGERLTGPQIAQFRDALCDVFDREEIKDLLLTDLDININKIPQTGRFDIDVREVIEWVEKEVQTLELLQSALRRKANRSKLLNDFAQQLGVVLSIGIMTTNQLSNTTSSTIIDSTTQKSTATSSSTITQDSLQRKIRDMGSILNVVQWRTQLSEIERHICRVEINDRAVGTGFLLGPDIVITSYHVMEKVINGPDTKEDVILRFDYKLMEDGKTPNVGTMYQLAENNWLIDFSYYSQLDQSIHEDIAEQALHELDYALLRTDGKPGEEWMSDMSTYAGPLWRQHMRIPQKRQDFKPDMPLYIMHHPNGDPLTLTQDTSSVIKVNNNKTRVRYRANTEYGSSGSPCFTMNWELIAIHQSGDPDFHPSHKPEYNQGVPIAMILTLLEKRGKKQLLEEVQNYHYPTSIPLADLSSIQFTLPEGGMSTEVRILLSVFLEKCKPGRLNARQASQQKPIILTEEELTSITEQLRPAHICLLAEGYMEIVLSAVEEAQMPFINIGEMRLMHFQQAIESLQRMKDCLLKIRIVLNAASSLPQAISVGREQLIAEVDRLITSGEKLIAHIDRTEKPHCDLKERRSIKDECRELREALNDFGHNLQQQG